MEKICIVCPKGCRLSISQDGDKINVSGNFCPRGVKYAQQELTVCPKCGSDNIDKLQRITGYLVGTTERWNKAKLAELNDRIIHK